MHVWVIENEPPIDASVLSAYENMRDEFPQCDIYPFSEKEYKMLICGLKETMKMQSYFQKVGKFGNRLEPVDKTEGLYNPFLNIYKADDDMLELLEITLNMLSEHSQRIEPVDRTPYYMVPMPINWESIFPFFLKGITSFTERMVNDLQGGGFYE